MITFDDFQKLDIRVGTIIEAERVPDADKLLQLKVDFGDEERQIVSGIAEYYAPEDLINRQAPFIVNLEPRTFRGVESQGMILAADNDGGVALLHPDQHLPSGSRVR